MDLASILRAVLHRWWVLLIGLVLTGAGAWAVYGAVPLSYQVTSQAIILLPRTAQTMDYDTNPYLYIPNGLSVLAKVVTIEPNTANFHAAMQRDGFMAQYELDAEPREPMVRFSVEGRDPEMVRATHRELLRRFEAELARLQEREEAPARQTAIVRFLDAESEPVAISGDSFRAAAMTAAVGVLLTLLLIFLLERRSQRSKPRRAGSVEESLGDDVPGQAAASPAKSSAAEESPPEHASRRFGRRRK